MTTLATHREQQDTGRGRPLVPDDTWHAIASRDARRDGQFVYGVRTTHIYCRPSCASRQPRRDHVEVFAAPTSAEQAGYRACKRCEPALAVAPDRGAALVQRACTFIDAHLDSTLSLAAIARAAHGSPAHVQRTFTRVLGISPRAYVAAKREHRLRGALRTGHSVGRAVFEAGYGSSRPVYGSATAPLGMTPVTYRTGGAGATIRYTVVASPLGQLLVAATDRGVCSVRLGDDAAELEAGLRSEFAAARFERAPGAPRAWVTAIRAALSGRGGSDAVPVDVRATAFQRRVWDALRRIPAGETRTYSEVAKSVGSPRAVRAVAHACAVNPVAIVVPCHRVIRTGGALAGYRWGIDRMRALLAAEGAIDEAVVSPGTRRRISRGRKRASATG
jgi:AraC family transcriptional regulator of adaptative response/methylated-DNA-[protein]-cysteine methyltransferase